MFLNRKRVSLRCSAPRKCVIWFTCAFFVYLMFYHMRVGPFCKSRCEYRNDSKYPIHTISFNGMKIQIGSKINLQLQGQYGEILVGVIGETVSTEKHKEVFHSPSILELSFDSDARLRVSHTSEGQVQCYNVEWICLNISSVAALQESFDMAGAHWYGGASVYEPLWPVEKWSRKMKAFVSGDSFNDMYGVVQERYWLSSKGVAIFVDYETPLFVAMNQTGDRRLKFRSQYKYPYRNGNRKPLFMNYTICRADNITAMFLASAGKFWRLPVGIPDKRAFRYPIWSTWANFKSSINQTNIIEFARAINQHGFNNSHLIIDDGWSSQYGDFSFDPDKFPDPIQMVRSLQRDLGFRVTLWVHYFASPFSEAIWKKDSEGNSLWVHWWGTAFPWFSSWWNGLCGVLDLTSPGARTWYMDELLRMKRVYGFDSFKFDGGEASWLSSWGRFINPPDTPNDYTRAYADIAYDIDPDVRIQEIRASVSSQHLPIFIRLMDKHSAWGSKNGLKSLIPNVLLFSVIGFPFSLPDMIGGNAYFGSSIHDICWPDRELYIRWLEASALLPSMQFSAAPWHYDAGVVRISLKMCALHERYADTIIGLAEEATRTGSPIIRPLWWIAPHDETALTIDSEFLLGDDLLVAPILDAGAVFRDVYLPPGNWKDELRGKVLPGGQWYRNYTVQLDELAHFTRLEQVIT